MKNLLLKASALLTALLVAGSAIAGPDLCLSYDPFTWDCLSWVPPLLPNSNWCTGDPGMFQVNIYTQTNYGGTCQTVNVNVSVPDTSAVGWNNTTGPVSTYIRINSMKVGKHGMIRFYPATSYGGAYTDVTWSSPDVSGIPAASVGIWAH